MPLFADGLTKIRKALLLVQAGKHSPFVRVGRFTPEQLARINEKRSSDELDPIDAVIIFNGKHLYKSRCVKDGYTIDEVLQQIESAFSETAEVSHDNSTTIANQVARIDNRGNAVKDLIIFECSQRKPSPLLWSVIPKGDGRKR